MDPTVGMVSQRPAATGDRLNPSILDVGESISPPVTVVDLPLVNLAETEREVDQVDTQVSRQLATYSNFQDDADGQLRSFSEALTRYQDKTVGTKYQLALDFKKLHTWDEVLEYVDQASTLYNDVPGAWGKIRKGLRKFGKTDQVFQAWAVLLPSQSEYFSVLCGGFKLICGVSELRR
jgi:hypothetical protein